MVEAVWNEAYWNTRGVFFNKDGSIYIIPGSTTRSPPPSGLPAGLDGLRRQQRVAHWEPMWGRVPEYRNDRDSSQAERYRENNSEDQQMTDARETIAKGALVD